MPIRLNEQYRALLGFALVMGAILYFGSASDARHAAEKAVAMKRIKAAPAFAAGTVTEFTQPRRRPSLFRGLYTFGVMGQLYHGIKDDWKMKDRESDILGKLFTVVYERDNPDNNAILIFRSDFRDFGLPYDTIRSIDDNH